MKIFISFIFIFISLPTFAQIVVSGVDINAVDSIKVCTVKIDGIEQILGDMDVSVDYGQIEKRATKRFTDKVTGKKLTFNSIAHVLNYMENNGWHHYDSQILDTRMTTIYYYYFRKK
ncbi:hypothetical protein L0657_20950 [Dyadobacter sp. CY345]|uniref:hypothetical protein n=1 Tax=Dyadobacter sp. CY345 TaxID=2909335 RepID=UPI001F1C2960|nr:hypothetical protein [Dyadobacter sp. CY345]MCF2446440.1 hypothetical protein [Dyadobacter sp. CY345]